MRYFIPFCLLPPYFPSFSVGATFDFHFNVSSFLYANANNMTISYFLPPVLVSSGYCNKALQTG